MLLRFSAANHLSLRGRQELSLVASSLKDDETGLIECGPAPSGKVLPAAVIYGANASGKSNLLDALRHMHALVAFSHSRFEPGSGVRRKPFVLDPACANAPSLFDVDFVVEEVRYHYGFQASDRVFEVEWLYAFPRGRRQTLFEREGQEFSFGRELRGRNRVIAELTRPNSLFVSAAAQNGHEELSKISQFFQTLRFRSAAVVPDDLALLENTEDEVDPRVIRFLHEVGTGVTGYRRRERVLPEDLRKLYDIFSSAVEERKLPVSFQGPRDGKITNLQLAHQGLDGKSVFLDLARESDGTRRLMTLLGPLYSALDDGAPLLVDELDSSLHTLACEAVLKLFCSSVSNPRGAQIIATTHDTNLLSSPVLRRDQIWFTEKDAEGATHVYPLTDIRSRKGDNIEKGYLQGRYGAIPFSGSIADILEAE